VVAIYPIPYLEPDVVSGDLECAGRGHAAVVTAAMDRVRADLATRPAGTRSVVLAHVFATGGEACGSERDITVGGLSTVPLSAFDGVDYAALGHLHGSQRLAENVRYSGSPLPYSFSENHVKSSLVVDLDDRGQVHVDRIDIPVHRPLARLRGTLQDLLTDPGLARHEGSFLSITLTDPVRPVDPMRAMRTRFPHVLTLAFEPEGRPALGEEGYLRRMRGRSDLQIATGFVEFVRERAVDEWERTLLREAVAHAHSHTEAVGA
jgi:exonuclease SbcD